jgi:hypothetical protein
MLFFIHNIYRQLFSKNFFERLVIYILLSLFFSKFYSEVILGQSVYYNPRIAQWVFYIVLAIDYIVNMKKIITMKIQFNAMSGFAFSLFFMIFHGLIVGIYNKNPWFLVFNDTIPFLMIAINILRMQSTTENDVPIDFGFLFRFCGLITICSSLLSFVLQKAGIIHYATLKVETIYLCLFFATLFTDYKLRLWDIFYFLVVMSLGVTQMNRTTLAFIAIIAFIICLRKIMSNPLRGGMIIVMSIVVIMVAFYSLPEDSPTYRRIIGIQNIDFSKRTGSVGERQQEQDSVNLELRQKGRTDELVGMGMGGSYTMKTTFTTIKDYGHAHFSWVWFKMRFGEIGYVYLGFFTLALLINAITLLNTRDPLNITISLLCFYSLLYMGTYVNAVFLLSGLQFLYVRNRRKENYVDNY